MASIGALATAAAHELGTPLGTIAVVGRELERALPPDSPEAEDARLLRAEAERCRGILTTLARPEESVIEATQRLPLGALLDDIAAAIAARTSTSSIETEEGAWAPSRKSGASPELIHGLGNFIANAADFADARVRVHRGLERQRICASRWRMTGRASRPRSSSGSASLMSPRAPAPMRLGETELEPSEAFSGQQGMGLGFFIAKTLIEQTGGTRPRPEPAARAARVVSVRWPQGRHRRRKAARQRGRALAACCNHSAFWLAPSGLEGAMRARSARDP